MIRIVCTSCQKPLSLDESKLPMKEVAFPCPVCRTKLSIDRSKLTPEGAAADAASDPSHAEHDAHDEHGVGAKALLVGEDSPALRQALKLVGFVPVYFPAAQAARDYFAQEFPHCIVVHPAQMTPPPLQELQPIIALAPADRRKTFIALVADNLRTLDGNAAFLYGVNLIVASRDLPQFPQIFRDATAYHDRMYGAFDSVVKAMNA